MAKAIDNLMLTIVPVMGALISAASVYYVMTMIDFPTADLFAGFVFVLALYRNWGDDSTDAF